MAGTKNGTLVGKNADFTQVDAPNAQSSESNGLITDGQLWIGRTAVNAGGTHITVGNISAVAGGSGISIVNGAGSIAVRMQSPYALSDFSFTGGDVDVTRSANSSTVFTITGNTGTTLADAQTVTYVGASSTGDASWKVAIAAVISYAGGIDNSDSDAFKINTDASGNVTPSSGTNIFKLTAGGIPSFAQAGWTTDGVLYSLANGVMASTAAGTAGQVLTSNGAGVAPTYQANSSITWSVITADQTAAVNNGYICNKGSALVLTLPATAAIGDIIRVTGINTALGWKIAQSANQQIFFGTSSTTLGVTGFLQSSAIRDSIEIVCVVAGAASVYNVLSSVGNITVS